MPMTQANQISIDYYSELSVIAPSAVYGMTSHAQHVCHLPNPVPFK